MAQRKTGERNMKRIPSNPETTLDKLRLLRREWVKEKVRSDKEMVKVYDMLNELIKELQKKKETTQ